MLDPLSEIHDEAVAPEPDLDASIRRADAATFWGFLAAAVLAQAGLFAASLGLMLAGFRGQWALGGLLVGLGLLGVGTAVGIARWHRHR